MATLASIIRKYTQGFKQYHQVVKHLSAHCLPLRENYRPTACEVCGNALNLLPQGAPTVTHRLPMGNGEILVVCVYTTDLGGGYTSREITLQYNNPLCAGEVTAFALAANGYTKCTCQW